jgi:hypothetical protein
MVRRKGKASTSTEGDRKLSLDAVLAHGLLLVRLDAHIARGPGGAEQIKFFVGVGVEESKRSGLIHSSRQQTPGAGDTPTLQTAIRQIIEGVTECRLQDELGRAARERCFRAARNEGDLVRSLRVRRRGAR